MKLYEVGAYEPPITSPDHSVHRLSRAFGSFIGRIVLASDGQDFGSAISAISHAFPGHVDKIHVHGLMSAGNTASNIAITAAMRDGLAGLRDARGFDRVADTGTSDSTSSFTFAEHITGELMRLWSLTSNDDRYGFVFVTGDDTLPDPYSEQPSELARVYRLSGVSAQIPGAELDLQWQQLHPTTE